MLPNWRPGSSPRAGGCRKGWSSSIARSRSIWRRGRRCLSGRDLAPLRSRDRGWKVRRPLPGPRDDARRRHRAGRSSSPPTRSPCRSRSRARTSPCAVGSFPPARSWSPTPNSAPPCSWASRTSSSSKIVLHRLRLLSECVSFANFIISFAVRVVDAASVVFAVSAVSAGAAAARSVRPWLAKWRS